MGTLKGPLHGGANERVFDMLTEIREMGDTKAYLKEKLDSQEKKSWALVTVFIKHKTHVKNILREMAQALTEGTENEVWFNLSREIEDYMKHTKRAYSKCRFLFGNGLPCSWY